MAVWKAFPVRVRQMVVLCVGLALIGVGMVAIVLPGPFTLPLLLAGTVVLATEFAWAHGLLAWLNTALAGAAARWHAIPPQARVLLVAVTAAALIGLASWLLTHSPAFLPAWASDWFMR